MESKAKQRRAKVAYSYQAENLDELTLVPGQVGRLNHCTVCTVCVQILYLWS